MLGLTKFSSVITSALFLQGALAIDLVPIQAPPSPISHTTKTNQVGRRDDTTDFDLQNVESFYWGAPTMPGQGYLANLTVYYPLDHEHVISMDRFAKNLERVECKNPDLMLDFKDSKSLQAAKKAWKWVDDHDDNYFIMVTDHPGCAPADQRQPFRVTSVRYDEDKAIAYLNAHAAPWKQIAHSYHLRVGHVAQNFHQLQRRIGGSYALSLESSFNGDWFEMSANGLTAKAGCVDCGTEGKMNFEFDLDVGFLKINEATLKISPEDVVAKMELGFETSGSLKTDWGWEKTIVSIPIEGVSLVDVIKIGGFFDVDAGVQFKNWTGTVTASMGAQMTLSNDALLSLDLMDSNNNEVSGWTPSFEAIPFHVSAKVECSAEAYAKPNIKLEAEAFDYGWEVGLGLRMPYVEADLSFTTDSAGVCDTDQTTGIEGSLKVGVDLEADAAKASDPGNPFWTWTILDQSWPLADVCIPFGSDGNPEPTPPGGNGTSTYTPTPTPTGGPGNGTSTYAPTSTPTPTPPSNSTFYRPRRAALPVGYGY